MRDIAQLCDQLGIKLIPEIDIPGHSLAFSKYPAFSEYILCKDPTSRHKMFDGQYIKGGPGSASWNPGREESYVHITNIVKDLLTVLPGVEVIHLGGDEVSKTKCWGSDPYV